MADVVLTELGRVSRARVTQIMNLHQSRAGYPGGDAVLAARLQGTGAGCDHRALTRYLTQRFYQVYHTDLGPHA